MQFRCIVPFCVAMLVLVAGSGCRKSESEPDARTTVAPVAAESAARIHWLGKKRVAAETNATAFMEVWDLPQSATLGAQTLAKLALAPWRLLKDDDATNGAPSELLRSLLDDLVQEESYLEIRGDTNQPVELTLAIRVNAERAGVWQTNLGTVLESLTGNKPTPAAGNRPGWSIKGTGRLNLIELTRAGEWTVIGMAREKNSLLEGFLGRIGRDGAPLAARSANFWVEADFDLLRVSRALDLGWSLPVELPRVSLTMIGDGKWVNSRAQLNFAKPLNLQLDPWSIPTNLIHDPLVSFIAIRGIKPWSESLSKGRIHMPILNQVFGWAQHGFPLQTYVAAPVPNASNEVHLLTESLLKAGNSWLKTNGIGDLERSGSGVTWTRLPMVQTFVDSTTASNGEEFIFAGWLPYAPTNQPPPPELLDFLSVKTNLIAYDWEITQPRVEGWLLISQTLRLALFKGQLPAASASMAWLKFAGLKLGNSVTTATLTGPAQISVARQSSVGFTAFELHLLTDWLESPTFPVGLNSFVSQAEGGIQRYIKARTQQTPPSPDAQKP